MKPDFHGVKESTEIGVILCELISSLGKDEGDGFNVHGEGDVMV